MLVAKGVDFPKTHDLSALNMLCNDNGILTGFSPKALTLLTNHAVTACYPGEAPTPEDAKESFEIEKAIRIFARKWLGLRK